MALVEGPAGNFSYDVLRWVFNASIRRPILRRRLVANVERMAGVGMRSRRLAKLLSSDQAFELICAGDSEGLGLLLESAAKGPVGFVVLGQAAVNAFQAQADQLTRMGLVQLDQGRSLEGGQGVLLDGLEALKDGQAVLFEQLCDALESQSGVALLVADPRAEEFRPVDLTERDDDIDRLWDQTEVVPGGYLVVTGDPWAGKTAVMAEMALDPPAGWDVVSFFVRAVGQRNTAAHFLDVVNRQLCHVLGEREDGQDLARRRATFEHLWARAAREAGREQRRLVLLIDGLDEQNVDVDVPISALLPAFVNDWARVVVATRPNPQRHPELATTHPYYQASRDPVTLEPSDAARRVADLAREAVKRIAQHGEPRTRQVLGLLAVADGPLTARDLVVLVGCDLHDLERVMGGLERNLIGDGTDAHPWELGHVEFQRSSHLELSKIAGLLEGCEARIDQWADTYHNEGWPPETPTYLLGSYASMLVRRRLPRRVAWLISDSHEARVRARLRDRRRLIDATTAALTIYEQPARPIEDDDVWSICMLGLRRTEMLATATTIPADVVGGWARLGAWDDVTRLLDQITDDYQLSQAIISVTKATGIESRSTLEEHAERIRDPKDKAEALVAIANGLTDPDTPTVLEILNRAVQVAEHIDDSRWKTRALAEIAEALAAHDVDTAQAVLAQAVQASKHTDDEPHTSWAPVAIAKALVLHDPDAPDEIAQARQMTEYTDDVWYKGHALAAVAKALVEHAPSDPDIAMQARQLAETIEDPWPKIDAFVAIAKALAGYDVAAARAVFAKAEHTAERLDDELFKAGGLATVAEALAGYDVAAARAVFAKAEQVAEHIEDPSFKSERLVMVAEALAGCDVAAARAVFAKAEQVAEHIEDPKDKSWAYAWIAKALVDRDVATARTILAKAEQVAERIEDPKDKSRALVVVAEALAGYDVAAAQDLLNEAEQVAEHIKDWMTETPYVPDEIVEALVEQAQNRPELVAHARQIATRIESPYFKVKALVTIAGALADCDPAALNVLEQAEQAAEYIDDDRISNARSDIAKALIEHDPSDPDIVARTQQITERIENPTYRNHAWMAIAEALVEHAPSDPDVVAQAEQITQHMGSANLKNRVLAVIAGALIEHDPSDPGLVAQAQQITERIEDPWFKSAWALVAMAKALARCDVAAADDALGTAAQVAEHIEDLQFRCIALNRVVKAMGDRETAAAGDVLTAAAQVAERVPDPFWSSMALKGIGEALAGRDDAAAQDVLIKAAQAAQHIQDPPRRSLALTRVAQPLAGRNVTAALDVATRAEQIAEQIDDSKDKTRAWVSIAKTEAPWNAAGARGAWARATEAAEHIDDPTDKDLAWKAIAEALVEHDPGATDVVAQAHQVTTHIEYPSFKSEALVKIAAALAAQDVTTERDAVPQKTWTILATLAKHPGFDDRHVPPALIRLGGNAGYRAVTARTLARL